MGQCAAHVGPLIDYEYQALGLKEQDLAVFEKCFNKFTAKKGGILTIDVLISVLELESSDVARRCFSIYDGAHNAHKTMRMSTGGKLSLKQFVLVVWNFCSMTIKTCGCLLFEIYDVGCKGTLITDDIVVVLSDLKVPKDKINGALHDFPGTPLYDGRHSYDVERWELMCAKYSGFFINFVENQTRVKDFVGGMKFWNQLLERKFEGLRGIVCPVYKYVEKFIAHYMRENFESGKIKWPTMCLSLILDEYYKIHEQEIEARKLRYHQQSAAKLELVEVQPEPVPEKEYLHGVPRKMVYDKKDKTNKDVVPWEQKKSSDTYDAQPQVLEPQNAKRRSSFDKAMESTNNNGVGAGAGAGAGAGRRTSKESIRVDELQLPNAGAATPLGVGRDQRRNSRDGGTSVGSGGGRPTLSELESPAAVAKPSGRTDMNCKSTDRETVVESVRVLKNSSTMSTDSEAKSSPTERKRRNSFDHHPSVRSSVRSTGPSTGNSEPSPKTGKGVRRRSFDASYESTRGGRRVPPKFDCDL